jgi:hypothetical protein
MDESAHPSKPDNETPTPEVAQLLKSLDLQSAAGRREWRDFAPKSIQGDCFRYGSLIAIVIFALASVWVMEWMVSQLPKPKAAAHASSTPLPAIPVPPAKTGTFAPFAGANRSPAN